MASRKEVFRNKVLRKLYPLPAKVENAPIPVAEALPVTDKTNRRVTAKPSLTADGERACLPHRRLYTVLPPPADYKPPEVGSEFGHTDAEAGPAGETDEDVSEEDGGGQQRRKRRRRKRKAKGVDSAGANNSPVVQAIGLVVGDSEAGLTPDLAGGNMGLSRNRKRKLKKKRHKEKLLSLGLVTGAAALQFTYQPSEGSVDARVEDNEEVKEQEEEEGETQESEERVEELLDFLQATLEVCDRSSVGGWCQGLSPVPSPQALLKRLSTRAVTASDLAHLWCLRSLVMMRDVARLSSELQHFQQGSAMPPEEVAAVSSLFQYWITDILPSESNKESGTQTA